MSTGCARCSHERVAHLHYRGGTDCSLCTCTAFTRFAWLHRALPTPVPRPTRPRLLLVAVDGVLVA